MNLAVGKGPSRIMSTVALEKRASQHDKQQLITAWKTTLELANRKVDQCAPDVEPHPRPSYPGCRFTSLNVSRWLWTLASIEAMATPTVICAFKKLESGQMNSKLSKNPGLVVLSPRVLQILSQHIVVSLTLVRTSWQQRPGKGIMITPEDIPLYNGGVPRSLFCISFI